MSYIPSALARFQRDVTQRLLCASSLQTVSIISARPRRNAAGEAVSDTAIQTLLNGALTGLVKRSEKGGLSIEVGMPSFRGDGGGGVNATGALDLPIFVRENPIFNMGATGTLIEAERACELVVQELHSFSQIERGGSARTLVLAKEAISPLAAEGASPAVMYQVLFTRQHAIPRAARVGDPLITFAAGAATLTCATAGATIRYSVADEDGAGGEYPGENAEAAGPEIPGVFTYSGPVGLAPGCMIRAVATKAGMMSSNLIEFMAS